MKLLKDPTSLHLSRLEEITNAAYSNLGDSRDTENKSFTCLQTLYKLADPNNEIRQLY